MVIKASLMAVGVCSTVLLAASTAVTPPPTDLERNWPQWRGPLGTGEAPHAKPPLEWSETKNLRWKTPIPGLGKSTPVVWNDLVFVTSAIPKTPTKPGAADAVHEFVLFAVARADGKVKWQKTAYEMLRSLVGSEMCIRDRFHRSSAPHTLPPVLSLIHI